MTKIQTGIKIAAPATVAHLNCGVNSLAMALEGPADEVVIFKFGQPGLRIRTIQGDKKKLSTEISENPAGLAALAVWRYLIEQHGVEAQVGIELEIRKKIGMESGMGSNEALIVAGGMAMNEFFGGPLTKRELLPLLAAAEYGALGTLSMPALAACLLGSCMLVRDADACDVHRVPLPRGLFFAMLTPNIAMSKQENVHIPLQNASAQASNLAALILGLFNTDFTLISNALQENFLLEAKRQAAIPHFDAMKEAVLASGALGFGLAGDGPSVFAFCNSSFKAEECLVKMQAIFDQYKQKYTAWVSAVNMEGAELV